MEHEKEQPSDGVIYVCDAGSQPLARWFKRKEDEMKKRNQKSYYKVLYSCSCYDEKLETRGGMEANG